MAEAATPPTAQPGRKSDLGIRVVSGVVMIVLAVAALSLGGPILTIFVAVIALGVIWEAWGLIRRITSNAAARLVAMLCLAAYAMGAAAGLLFAPAGLRWLAVASVIATDTGAYFTGRALGGPKIAPSISPSKTWAGLAGGILGAASVMMVFTMMLAYALTGLDEGAPSFLDMTLPVSGVALAVGIGALVAILAQAGDFFESWLKRRAGVKDSGALIPGHGGLFDRVDGLLPIACLLGILVAGRWV